MLQHRHFGNTPTHEWITMVLNPISQNLDGVPHSAVGSGCICGKSICLDKRDFLSDNKSARGSYEPLGTHMTYSIFAWSGYVGLSTDINHKF